MKTNEQVIQELSIVSNITEKELWTMPINRLVTLMKAHGITFEEEEK